MLPLSLLPDLVTRPCLGVHGEGGHGLDRRVEGVRGGNVGALLGLDGAHHRLVVKLEGGLVVVIRAELPLGEALGHVVVADVLDDGCARNVGCQQNAPGISTRGSHRHLRRAVMSWAATATRRTVGVLLLVHHPALFGGGACEAHGHEIPTSARE